MTRGPWWQSPVLESVVPVIGNSQLVSTNIEAVENVARWMAHEEFQFPVGSILGPFELAAPASTVVDAGMFVGVLNFAFTDFTTAVKYEVDYQGGRWSDTEGMFARVHRAVLAGEPILTGEWMAAATDAELTDLFGQSLPMIRERVEILNSVGTVLCDEYEGAFHRFVQDCPPAMYASGDGLLERMTTEFPRFRDVSSVDGHEVQFYKLGQLSLWLLHIALHASGDFVLEDLSSVSAFADYIVPVALEVMGITEYVPDLADTIAEGELIERDSRAEVEIRAHTLYATALLTDAINEIRSDDAQLIVPQVDYRLWKAYHSTFRPHHLTRTIMY
ncbi:MAG: queuosine salvage family protein [Acidimicrobiia bacterium]